MNRMTQPESLSSENYDSWKTHIQGLLMQNGLWGYVSGDIPEPSSEEPAAETEKWMDGDTKARTTIILSLKSSDLKKIKNCSTSRSMWTKLEEIHRSTRSGRKAMMLKSFLSIRMKEGDEVEAHINRFFELVDELNKMDLKMYDELLVAVMLLSLPPSYNNFKRDIESRDELPNIQELKVKIMEESGARKNETQQGEEEATTVKKRQHGRTGPRSKEELRGVRRKIKNLRHHFEQARRARLEKSLQPGTGEDENAALTSVVEKGELSGEGQPCADDHGISFTEAEHTSHSCIKKEEKILQPGTGEDKKAALTSVVEKGELSGEGQPCADDHGILFTEAERTSHSDNKIEKVVEKRQVTENQVSVANGDTSDIVACGDVRIVAQDNTMNELKGFSVEDAACAPEVKHKIRSVSRSKNKGHRVTFSDSHVFAGQENRNLILTGDRDGYVYHDREKPDKANNSELSSVNLRKMEKSLEHLDVKDLQGMDQNGDKNGMMIGPVSQGLTCPMESSSASKLGDTIHLDIPGPMSRESLDKMKFFVTFPDDNTRSTEVYFIKDKFKEGKAKTKKLSGNKIKYSQSDNSTEYVKDTFDTYPREHTLRIKTSGSQSSQELKLIDIERTAIIDGKLKKSFSADSESIVNYMENRCNATGEGNDNQNPEQIFVGYPIQSKGRKLVNAVKKKFQNVRDVMLRENNGRIEKAKDENSPNKGRQKIFFNVEDHCNAKHSSVTTPKIETESEEDLEDGTVEKNLKQKNSKRGLMKLNIPKPEEQNADNLQVAQNVHEVSTRENRKLCLTVRNRANRRPVDRRRIKKALTNKMVFKVQRDAEGRIKHYTAKLVARSFVRRRNMEFGELFIHVARLNQIGNAVATEIEKELRRRELDGNAACVEGEVEEEIYIKQSEPTDEDNETALLLARQLSKLQNNGRRFYRRFWRRSN